MDMIQGIFKPVSEVDAGCFAAPHEGIDDRSIFCRTVIAAKKIVLFSECDASDTVFHQVVVYQVSSVKEITFQSGVAVTGILDGFADRTFGQRFRVFPQKLFFK